MRPAHGRPRLPAATAALRDRLPADAGTDVQHAHETAVEAAGASLRGQRRQRSRHLARTAAFSVLASGRPYVLSLFGDRPDLREPLQRGFKDLDVVTCQTPCTCSCATQNVAYSTHIIMRCIFSCFVVRPPLHLISSARAIQCCSSIAHPSSLGTLTTKLCLAVAVAGVRMLTIVRLLFPVLAQSFVLACARDVVQSSGAGVGGGRE